MEQVIETTATKIETPSKPSIESLKETPYYKKIDTEFAQLRLKLGQLQYEQFMYKVKLDDYDSEIHKLLEEMKILDKKAADYLSNDQ